MNDKERRAAKYLPFDALKGLKERIEQEDKKNSIKEPPKLSEDEKLEMNFKLFECYSKNYAITIHYFSENGILEYSGVIQKIDILQQQLVLLPKKKFNMNSIYKIEVKDFNS